MATRTALSASTVTHSIGVNMHIDFGYQNVTTTASAINYLGSESARFPDHPNDVGSGGNWQRIANATGAKFDAYMPDLRADGGRLPFSKITRPPMETSAS